MYFCIILTLFQEVSSLHSKRFAGNSARTVCMVRRTNWWQFPNNICGSKIVERRIVANRSYVCESSPASAELSSVSKAQSTESPCFQHSTNHTSQMECHRSFVHVDDQRHLDTLGQSTVHHRKNMRMPHKLVKNMASILGVKNWLQKQESPTLALCIPKKLIVLVLRRLATTISVVGKQLPKVESQIHHFKEKHKIHIASFWDNPCPTFSCISVTDRVTGIRLMQAGEIYR